MHSLGEEKNPTVLEQTQIILCSFLLVTKDQTILNSQALMEVFMWILLQAEFDTPLL